MKRFFGLAALLPTFLSVSAVYLTEPSKLPSNTYDYIIVGGGTAGNVVASRLSENNKYSVLVLEAGYDQTDNTDVNAPLLCVGLTPNTPIDWNYTTTAQPGFNGRSIPFARGFGLGGSSLTNYMIHNRGSQDDWDSYARIAGGDASLKWENIYPLRAVHENFTMPVTTRDISNEYEVSAHAKTGLLGVSLPSMSVSYDNHVIGVTKQLAEFPFQQDMNAGTPLGIGWTQSSIANGNRTNSYSAYVHPFLSRPNLAVLGGAHVTRVVQTGSVRGVPIFRGVEFATSASGPRINVTARKEVILAAGAFNTPQILMLSGIGDSTALTHAGIHPLVNLPSVGQNMSDHVLLPNKFPSTANDTFNSWEITANLTPDMAQWEKTHDGPVSDSGFRQLGFLRVPSNNTLFQTHADPSAGPTSAHYEFAFVHGTFPSEDAEVGKSYVSIVICLLTPTSRGTVGLASKDPFAHPIINPNWLNTDFDKGLMVYALRSALRYAQAPAMQGYLNTTGAFNGATTDAQLINYAAENSGTVWHPIGTAAMSPANADWGVVNPDLTVKKVMGLSVVDAASIPYVPSMHPQGVIYLWAERAANQIKARA